MNKSEIYDLMDRFERSSLTAMEVEENNFRISFERNGAAETGNMNMPADGKSVATEEKEAAAAVREPAADCIAVKSPIVGVFYRASEPGEEPFVSEGQKVEKGQTLCLVEAMKMMNELKAPEEGVIESIQASDGDMVEFDQILFEVKSC